MSAPRAASTTSVTASVLRTSAHLRRILTPDPHANLSRSIERRGHESHRLPCPWKPNSLRIGLRIIRVAIGILNLKARHVPSRGRAGRLQSLVHDETSREVDCALRRCERERSRVVRFKECKMRKLVIATVVFVLTGLPASYARGSMHGFGSHGLMAPANPTVPPALTPDPRIIGTAPLPPHHQPTLADTPSVPDTTLKPTPGEVAVDRAIGNICRGC